MDVVVQREPIHKTLSIHSGSSQAHQRWHGPDILRGRPSKCCRIAGAGVHRRRTNRSGYHAERTQKDGKAALCRTSMAHWNTGKVIPVFCLRRLDRSKTVGSRKENLQKRTVRESSSRGKIKMAAVYWGSGCLYKTNRNTSKASESRVLESPSLAVCKFSGPHFLAVRFGMARRKESSAPVQQDLLRRRAATRTFS